MTRIPIVYLRKSHLASADNDLEAHERRALAKMQERGESDPIILAEEEGHRSGFSDAHRPAYKELERLVEADKVSTIYINDRARIWRNAMEYMQFLMFCVKHQTDVVPSIEAPIGDVSDPNQQLIEFIQGWQNEQYRNKISNSLRATKQDLKNAGLPYGNQARFGLKLVGSMFQRRLEPSDDLPIVLELLHLYIVGDVGCARVAETLAQRGHTWKNGKRRTRINERSVGELIAHVEDFQPFIHALLYEQVLAKRARMSNHASNGAAGTHPKLLLSMCLYCAKCGTRYRSITKLPGKANQLANPQRGYFHRHARPCDTPQRWVRASVAHAQVWEQLEELQATLLLHLDEMLARLDLPSDTQSSQLDYELTKEKLSQELLTLRRNYNRGDFGDTAEASTRAYFLSEQARVQKAITALVPPPPAEPHGVLDRARLEELRTMPLAELREAAETNPDLGNEWMAANIERVEIWGTTVTVKMFAGLLELLPDQQV